MPFLNTRATVVANIMNNTTKLGQETEAGKAGGVRGRDKYLREMNFTPELTHLPAEHLGKPIVGSSEDSKNGGYTHNDVEMGHHKVGVVQVNIGWRLIQEQATDSTCDKQRDKTNGK